MKEFTKISGDQLIIRLGKACNFKCSFCNISNNEKNIKTIENIYDLVRQFHYKFKYSKINFFGELKVIISGGEPSLFKKETIFILKYIKNFLDKKGIKVIFDIQTNASNIDKDFAEKLKENGVSGALVSFHMIEKEIFEKVIGVDYNNFYKIIDGINNLYNAGINIYTNTVINNENKNNFFETIKFLRSTFSFIKGFSIGIVQPHGQALKNIKICPKYEDIYKEYNKVIFFLGKGKKNIFSDFVGPPLCYLLRLSSGLELYHNISFRKNFNFSEKYLINNINDKNKLQTKSCQKCLYNNVCSGIWKEYIGLQKLKPINYIVNKNNNFDKNNFAYKLKNKSEHLKKIYDGNIRQIIIPTSIGNKTEIYELLKNATKLGFYKVSLFIDSDFNLKKDIVYTGVSNIQLKKENISKEVLLFILDFSKKYSPQFRIDLDFI